MNLFKRKETSLTNSVISPNSVIRQFGNSVISPNSVIRPFGHSAIRKASQGFTLIELIVVVGMIAILLGAMTTSISSARDRARIQKATSDVKVISQAILARENWEKGGKYELPLMERRDADSGSLNFLLGKESASTGDKIPVMLMAQLRSGGKMVDPWGTPYKISIRKGTVSAAQKVQLQTGYFLPNFYRIGAGERQ